MGLREVLAAASAGRGGALEVLVAFEREAYLDCRLIAAASERLSAAGLAMPQRTEWVPGVGETYGLFYGGQISRAAPVVVSRTPALGVEVVSIERSAERQVRVALSALAGALHAAGRGVPVSLSRGHRVRAVVAAGESVDGSSLGLATAVAALSRYLGEAPATDVAGSAEVCADGRLVAIRHLGAKLDALRVCFPQVRAVVVAAEQALDDSRGFELVRCASLAEALAAFELDVASDVLRPAPVVEVRSVLGGFEARAAGAGEDWRLHYEKALAITDDGRLSDTERCKARLWAALFATHAGRAHAAVALLAEVPEAMQGALAPRHLAWLDIARAACAIDESPLDAARHARLAVELSESELQKGDWREVYGRASGTLGRACMHSGDYEQALPHLRVGAAHHAEENAVEEARSRIYVATCLRMLGRTGEALEECEAVRGLLDGAAERDAAAITRLYLSLEHGRSLLAAGEPEAAIRCLMACAQAADGDHPWIGALRSLCEAHRQCGRDDEADGFLSRCLAVAEDSEAASTIRRVAALAAFEQRGAASGPLGERARACVELHLSDDIVRVSLSHY